MRTLNYWNLSGLYQLACQNLILLDIRGEILVEKEDIFEILRVSFNN